MLEKLDVFKEMIFSMFSILSDFFTSFFNFIYLIFIEMPVYLYKFIDTLPNYFKYGFRALIVSVVAILILKLLALVFIRG